MIDFFGNCNWEQITNFLIQKYGFIVICAADLVKEAIENKSSENQLKIL